MDLSPRAAKMIKYDNAGHRVSVQYVLSAINRNHSPCPPDKEEKDIRGSLQSSVTSAPGDTHGPLENKEGGPWDPINASGQAVVPTAPVGRSYREIWAG